VEKCLASHPAGKYFQVTIHTDQHGRLQMHYQVNKELLDEDTKYDGLYLLRTNRPQTVSMNTLLCDYKGQYKVERQFSHLKHPHLVPAFYLKSNQRIQSLMFIIVLALMIYTLLERQCRKALQKAEYKHLSLHELYPEGRAYAPLTAKRIFAAFEYFAIVIRHKGTRKLIEAETFSSGQKKIFRLLNFPPLRKVLIFDQ
jgi:transposase